MDDDYWANLKFLDDREENPTRDLFEKRWAERGFDGLMTEEQEYLAVWWLDGEVENGGLDQYFNNSSGDMALLALSALNATGAVVTAGILREALAVFGEAGYTTERYARQKKLFEVSHNCDAFDKTSRALRKSSEPYVDMALARLRSVYAERGVIE
jgi:hypothetical protein